MNFIDPLKNNIKLPGVVITAPCTSVCNEIQQPGQDQRKIGVDEWSGFKKGLRTAVSSGVVLYLDRRTAEKRKKWHMSIFLSEHVAGEAALQ